MAYTYNGDLTRGTKDRNTGNNYVADFQSALNEAGGYGLTIDGSFGNQTQTALKDYQTKNGLQVTGMLDEATANLLTQQTTKPEGYNNLEWAGETEIWQPKAYDGSQNEAYVTAQNKATEYEANNRPAEYVSKYQNQIDSLFNQIMNREDFSYDVNSDALYQQYKEQYMSNGQKAMQDTMGQAAALTGGYGSTYAQSVGQQQYNAYLQKLNNVIPDLYNAAYDQWSSEGDRLRDLYSMQVQQEKNDYDRYTDNYNMYLTELNRLQNAADDAYTRGYQQNKDDNDYRTSKAEEYMNLVANYGMELPADMRAAYGISDAEYNILRNSYAAATKSGSGSPTTEPTDPVGPTAEQTALYNQILPNLTSTAYAKGNTQANTIAVLNNYVAKGMLTQEQAEDIAQQYVNAKNK